MIKNYTYIEVLNIKLVETKHNHKAPKHYVSLVLFIQKSLEYTEVLTIKLVEIKHNLKPKT